MEHPGDVDHRADIYALGVVFYQMLTGELPGKPIEPPSSKVQIDVRLDEVVLRALEKKPELRYQQVNVLKTQVETIATTPPGSSRREEAQTESERRKAESGKPSESLVTSAATNQTPRFSRTALAGAIWSGMGLLVCISAAVFELKASFADRLLALFFLTAPFGTTIFGWLAVSQIRRSAGKLHGMWLAVFDGLLSPLLALDLFIWFVCNVGLHQLLRNSFEPATRALVAAPALGVAAVICILLNIIIARLVWRVVNRPVAAPSPPVQKPDRFWRWFAVAVFAMISIPILISIVGLLAAIAIPNFVKARERARENAQHAAAQMATNQPAAPNLSFGPVMERVLVDSKIPFKSEAESTNALMMIDFDSGTLFSGSAAGRAADTDSQKQWMQTNGIDALCVIPGVGGLVGLDMKAVPVSPQAWKEISMAVIEQLSRSPRQETVSLTLTLPTAYALQKGKEAEPPTWLFQTREGGTGLLQITGFSVNPRGVKIRYKLLQNGGAADGIPAASVETGSPTAYGVDATPLTDSLNAVWVNHVALLAVECRGQNGVSRWSPDGTPLPATLQSMLARFEFPRRNGGSPDYVFTILLRDPPNSSFWKYWDGGCGAGSFNVTEYPWAEYARIETNSESGGIIFRLATTFNVEKKTTPVTFGLPWHPVRNLLRWDGHPFQLHVQPDWPESEPSPDLEIGPYQPFDPAVETNSPWLSAVTLKHLPKTLGSDWHLYLTVADRNHREHRSSYMVFGGGRETRIWMLDVPPTNIVSVKLQGHLNRDFVWSEFKDVHLKPNSPWK